MQIAIITDSTADIPQNLVKQFAIHVVPAIIVVEGQSLKDGVDISRNSFYQQLPSMTTQPTTATGQVNIFT